jgi:hypothetical protein
MTAAVWSTPPDVCAIDFPAKTLIRFMYNHHLLQITGKPSWLTIKGGRWVGCVEEHLFVLNFIIVKSTLSRYSPSCPPRSCTSQHLCTRSGQAKGARSWRWPRESEKRSTTSFSRATRTTRCASSTPVVAQRPRSEKPSVRSAGVGMRSGCIPMRAWVFILLFSPFRLLGGRNGG